MDEDKKNQPAQKQERQPGREHEMTPRPKVEKPTHKGSGKLEGKVAIITGGDSGIGRAVAVAFAIEGADCLISYLEEHEDAKETARMVEEKGRRCVTHAGDVGQESTCREIVVKTLKEFGKIDVLVNNAAVQYPKDDLMEISEEQLEKTFRTNIFSYFFLTKAALPNLKKGSAIVNTTSVTAYKGSSHLLDYSATKGAIVAFTRSLSQGLVSKEIRVNGVAPGPIWTPLIPASFPEDHVEEFGQQAPMERAGQPEEVALSYVFLASDDSSYMTGQVLHPNGGTIVNG